MERLGVFLLPLGWGIIIHCRVSHSIKFAGTHLYIWVERATVRVKCLTQGHSTMIFWGIFLFSSRLIWDFYCLRLTNSRQTGRKTDRQSEGRTDRQTDRRTDRQTRTNRRLNGLHWLIDFFIYWLITFDRLLSLMLTRTLSSPRSMDQETLLCTWPVGMGIM